jgi:ATP-dependent Clp protease protease subunit
MLASNQAMGRTQEGTAGSKATAGVVLPRLNPMDCYYLYNPDGYFRVE